jgi:hypothetical protein
MHSISFSDGIFYVVILTIQNLESWTAPTCVFFNFDFARQFTAKGRLAMLKHKGFDKFTACPLRKFLPIFFRWVDQWTTDSWPCLFAVHLIIKAKLEESK